jgi:hypothetical protein
MISDARRVYPECSQLVAPGYGGALILERTNRLPPVKPRIANGHWRVFGGTTQEAKTTHPHEGIRARQVCLSRCVTRVMNVCRPGKRSLLVKAG